jgi:D-tyrosyl-tRNA(Tyr) deacylase
MRVVIQRVGRAKVEVDGKTIADIGNGLLLFLGIEAADTPEDTDWLVRKIAAMRIFGDEAGLMNLSVVEIQGKIIVVSQFTLHANAKKGNRPSFIRAARPEQAEPMYKAFAQQLAEVSGVEVKTGVFGADMKVDLMNDGPVTILLDSKVKE